jgi:hypothetical protein
VDTPETRVSYERLAREARYQLDRPDTDEVQDPEAVDPLRELTEAITDADDQDAWDFALRLVADGAPRAINAYDRAPALSPTYDENGPTEEQVVAYVRAAFPLDVHDDESVMALKIADVMLSRYVDSILANGNEPEIAAYAVEWARGHLQVWTEIEEDTWHVPEPEGEDEEV